MKTHAFCAFFAFSTMCTGASHAAVSSLNGTSNIRPISQYGLIQNVQDYSLNPFWTKGSPYNQKFPQAVYVTGPELNTEECQNTVASLVSTYCSANENCVGMSLSDVRPFIMLQLSRMPGHNYASSCSGFIDSEFDAYVATYSIAVPNGYVSFPGATDANTNFDAPEFKLDNPYEIKDSTWNGEEWKKEKKERSQELKDLQSQNDAGNEGLARSDFPETFADLSFSERMDILQQGYEPYKDSSAFRGITIKEDNVTSEQRRAAYCESQKTVLADLNADLQTLKNCKTKGLPLAQCKTKGRY